MSQHSDEYAPVDKPRLGSLCTGILGLDRAVDQHFGARMAWYSEIEPAPITVIKREHPDAPNLGDLKMIDWATVPPIDVMTAGYPCQPFSHAGKRKGTDDPRHLWPFIIAGVRALRPRVVVLENVRGHLTLGFDTVLGDLAEAGFDAEWCLLRASDVGACHQRARVFIVARDTNRSRADAHAATGAPRGCAGESGGAVADTGGERHGGGQDAGAVGRVDSGDAGEARQRERARAIVGDRSGSALADATDLGHQRSGPARGRGHGPADSRQDAPLAVRRRLAGQQGASVGRDAVRADLRGDADRCCDEPDPDSDDFGCEGTVTWALGHDSGSDQGPVEWGQYEAAIRRHERTFGRPAPRPVDDAGQLAPRFVEWMMGYPEGWVDGLTRTQALKALGNAVVTRCAAVALTELAPCGQRLEVVE